MNTLTLGHRKIDSFVEEQIALGNDVRWDGWTLIFFRPEPKGVYSKDGAFRNGQWGFENRTPVNDSGLWEIDFRNVKRRIRKNRH